MKNGNCLVVIFKKNDGKYILFHFFSYCSHGEKSVGLTENQSYQTECSGEMREM